mgnify:CR=1 FL=1
MLERREMDRELAELAVIAQSVPTGHLLRKIDAAVEFNKRYEHIRASHSTAAHLERLCGIGRRHRQEKGAPWACLLRAAAPLFCNSGRFPAEIFIKSLHLGNMTCKAAEELLK